MCPTHNSEVYRFKCFNKTICYRSTGIRYKSSWLIVDVEKGFDCIFEALEYKREICMLFFDENTQTEGMELFSSVSCSDYQHRITLPNQFVGRIGSYMHFVHFRQSHQTFCGVEDTLFGLSISSASTNRGSYEVEFCSRRILIFCIAPKN